MKKLLGLLAVSGVGYVAFWLGYNRGWGGHVDLVGRLSPGGGAMDSLDLLQHTVSNLRGLTEEMELPDWLIQQIEHSRNHPEQQVSRPPRRVPATVVDAINCGPDCEGCTNCKGKD